MTNRFKGFYLIYSVPEELWMEVCILEAVIKSIPKKKKCKMAKWLSEETLQTPEEKKKKKMERQRRKGKIYPSECRVPKNSKER